MHSCPRAPVSGSLRNRNQERERAPGLWGSKASHSKPGWGPRAQSCPTLCDPMDCSPPGSSVHGISQARILEQGCQYPGDRPDPGIELESLALAGGFFTTNATLGPYQPLALERQTQGSVQVSSVTHLCPTLCDPMDCRRSGLPVHHQLPELIQTHVH